MFMHANWWHLIFNMWFLWIFGRNIEDSLGHFPYLLFYLICGIVAALAQIASDWTSLIPTVGASGAIAGVMGGYFVLFPRARVLMLVPFLFIFFLWLPAWAVLGYWFVLQFLSGVGTALVAPEGAQVGSHSGRHVGGFVAGVLLVRLFPLRDQALSVWKLKGAGGWGDDELVHACVWRQGDGIGHGLGNGRGRHHAAAWRRGPELLPDGGAGGSGKKRDDADAAGPKLLAQGFGEGGRPRLEVL